ncbi:hypothetical protein PMI06_000841 [Burkholderia sp. BT03]|nr:hypothetical protein PMI06_000841 [Burkholderia sp. BT03]
MPFKMVPSYGNRPSARIICRYSSDPPRSLGPRPSSPAGLPYGGFQPAAVRFGTRACHAETRLRQASLHCRRRGQTPGSTHRDGITVFLQTRKNNVSAVIEHLEGEAMEKHQSLRGRLVRRSIPVQQSPARDRVKVRSNDYILCNYLDFMYAKSAGVSTQNTTTSSTIYKGHIETMVHRINRFRFFCGDRA